MGTLSNKFGTLLSGKNKKSSNLTISAPLQQMLPVSALSGQALSPSLSPSPASNPSPQ
jgi:hypothetical protein